MHRNLNENELSKPLNVFMIILYSMRRIVLPVEKSPQHLNNV